VSYSTAFIAASTYGSAGADVYVDGVLVGTVARSATMDSTDGLRIGNALNTGTAHWDGIVAEVIVCDELTSANQDTVEGYLAHKWGLTANLPVGHPYTVSYTHLRAHET